MYTYCHHLSLPEALPICFLPPLEEFLDRSCWISPFEAAFRIRPAIAGPHRRHPSAQKLPMLPISQLANGMHAAKCARQATPSVRGGIHLFVWFIPFPGRAARLDRVSTDRKSVV